MTNEILSNALAGLFSGSTVVAVAWFFARRWMERVEAAPDKLATKMEALFDKFSSRMDQLERESRACSTEYMKNFRSKEDSEKAWVEQRATNACIWSELNALRERFAAIETACKLNHEKE